MNRAFDSGDFVRDLGIVLVREFEKARKATTPGLVGDAMERPVQRGLEQVLPHGMVESVGEGDADLERHRSRDADPFGLGR